jgi:Tol biopolymer transport system component
LGCVWPYVVRRDGTDLRRVMGRRAGGLDWSARNKLAFFHDDGTTIGAGPKDGIYTVKPDGTDLRRIWKPSDIGYAAGLDWSPDGSRLAFTTPTLDVLDNAEIHTIRADGRGLRRVTHFGPQQGQGIEAPHWSPDGRFISFVNNEDLYVMRANGRGLRRVVHTPASTPGYTRWQTLSGGTWLPKGAFR